MAESLPDGGEAHAGVDEVVAVVSLPLWADWQRREPQPPFFSAQNSAPYR
jgi:hypothetical protein